MSAPAPPRPPDFSVLRPWLARLTARAGPSTVQLWERAGARVLTVPGRYSTIQLLLGATTLVIVDVGSCADLPLLERALRWLGRSATEVGFLLPTHLHFDHALGLDAAALRLGAPLRLGPVAHAAVTRARPLRFPTPRQAWRALATWPMQGLPFPPAADWRLVREVGVPGGRNRLLAPLGPPLEHGGALPGLSGWTLLEAPGHSEDSIVLYHADAGFLVAGDTVRNFYGGEWNPLQLDPVAFARTRQLLQSLRVRTVFPGHGPVLDGPSVLRQLRRVPRGIP